MSNATITDKVVTTTAPVVARDELRDLIESINVGTSVVADVQSTLFGLVRSRFAQAAQPYGRDVRGLVVLPDSVKKDVQATLWNSATGSRTPTPSAERGPGLVSFAQYLSRMTTVATDVEHGLSALEDDDSAREAYAAIGDAKKADKKAADIRARQGAALAYRQWYDALPSATRAHVDKTVKLFSTDSVARTHATAFIEMLTIETSA